MKNLEKILENAFKIKRVGTSRSNKFKYNEFTRPVTHHCFFQLMADSDINLSSYELTKHIGFIKATDFVYNWRGDATLVVTDNVAYINVGGERIRLNYEKFINTYEWFQDETIFNTDFGNHYHSRDYYKKESS